MAKKILKIGGGLVGLATGGLPGALIGGLAGYGASKMLKKKHEPTGLGEPLPIGAINPDGSAIPMDRKRRRLTPAPNTILNNSAPAGTTLGG
jgi:hypothetical protein